MREDSRHTLEELLTLMAVLRDPQYGCPWDVKQDWASLVPHTLEEAYEVADAIERRAFDELPGELGDLLFQVVYYSQFGVEERRFDFHDVIDTLTAKMLARHPHVFPDGTLASRRQGVSAQAVETQEVNTRWENLKAEERLARESHSTLDDIPHSLPALSRATKLTKRASQVGFDWPDTHGVLDKIREELVEVEDALQADDREHLREEVGDLLFSVVNLARRLKLDPEQALRSTNRKFERRFRHVERSLNERGRSPQQADLAEMERYWNEAKRLEGGRFFKDP